MLAKCWLSGMAHSTGSSGSSWWMALNPGLNMSMRFPASLAARYRGSDQ